MPGGKAEEDQLGHLASIYSLRVRRDAPGAFSAFKTGQVARRSAGGSVLALEGGAAVPVSSVAGYVSVLLRLNAVVLVKVRS